MSKLTQLKNILAGMLSYKDSDWMLNNLDMAKDCIERYMENEKVEELTNGAELIKDVYKRLKDRAITHEQIYQERN